MNIKILILILLLFLILFLTGCKFLNYFIPPKESIIKFSIGDYSGEWTSDGFEGVADEKYIEFFSPPKDKFRAIRMNIALKKPVISKIYTEKDSMVEFLDGGTSTENVFNLDDKRTKIRINLIEWSDKPRGLIEGDIEATLYDYDGKKYEMKGHFKTYQALGTINSFH